MILVTGGTGTLGGEVVAQALDAGDSVRVLSRRDRPAGADPAVEWVRGDLATGAGLDEAVSGADAVIHCATVPGSGSEAVDVEGTRRVVQAARGAGVPHVLYPSIVGCDRVPVRYYRMKARAEAIVADGGVGWTILRATQFHSLLDGALRAVSRVPVILPIPVRFRFQPVAASEVANRLLGLARAEPSGRAPDMAGPEVLTLGEMARTWLDTRGVSRRIVRVPIPGRAARRVRDGVLTAPDQREGRTTWARWLTDSAAGGGR